MTLAREVWQKNEGESPIIIIIRFGWIDRLHGERTVYSPGETYYCHRVVDFPHHLYAELGYILSYHPQSYPRYLTYGRHNKDSFQEYREGEQPIAWDVER